MRSLQLSDTLGWVTRPNYRHTYNTPGFPPSDFATKPVNRRRLSQILKKYTCLRPPCPVLLIVSDPGRGGIVTGQSAALLRFRHRPGILWPTLVAAVGVVVADPADADGLPSSGPTRTAARTATTAAPRRSTTW